MELEAALQVFNLISLPGDLYRLGSDGMGFNNRNNAGASTSIPVQAVHWLLRYVSLGTYVGNICWAIITGEHNAIGGVSGEWLG